jgi:transcriptional regulator GlxA family with amidase domain
MLIAPPGATLTWQQTAGAREICLVFSMESDLRQLWETDCVEVISADLAKCLIPRLITIASMWWVSDRHRARSNALLTLILTELVDHWNPLLRLAEPPVLRESSDSRVLTAEDLARSRLNSWTVADMAAAVDMQRATFTRLYTRERGQSPGAWLDAARLSLAKSLLGQHDQGLSTIAQWTGHPRLPSFGRWFKTRVGISPGQFRRSLLGEADS